MYSISLALGRPRGHLVLSLSCQAEPIDLCNPSQFHTLGWALKAVKCNRVFLRCNRVVRHEGIIYRLDKEIGFQKDETRFQNAETLFLNSETRKSRIFFAMT